MYYDSLGVFKHILSDFENFRFLSRPYGPLKDGWFRDFGDFSLVFGQKLSKSPILEGSFWGQKSLIIELYGSKNRFFGLFDNFSLFLANPEKKIFFSIFHEFFSAQIRVFQIFAKWRQKNGVILQKSEKYVFGLKKIREKSKKIFFFRIG